MHITPEVAKDWQTLCHKLSTGVKPWPANLDKRKGLPSVKDKEQLERYVRSLTIANEASFQSELKPIANLFYNRIMLNAAELLTGELYEEFVRVRKSQKIYNNAEVPSQIHGEHTVSD